MPSGEARPEERRARKRFRRAILEWLAVHLFGGLLLPLLLRSWRTEYDDAQDLLGATRGGEQFIFVFWHNRQVPLIAPYRTARVPVKALISRHGDGEIIARVIRKFGIGTVRGSSTRGGVVALRRMVRESRDAHLCITPDGPLGPRYRFQGGAVLLASLSRRPIIGLTWSADRAWQFSSWDRFLLPKPFARIRFRASQPVRVPRPLSDGQLEEFRLLLEKRLSDLTAELDREMGREVDPLLEA